MHPCCLSPSNDRDEVTDHREAHVDDHHPKGLLVIPQNYLVVITALLFGAPHGLWRYADGPDSGE